MIKKTRGSILKSFQKNIKDLEALSVVEGNRHAAALEAAIRANEEAAQAVQEAEACLKVANKLKELING